MLVWIGWKQKYLEACKERDDARRERDEARKAVIDWQHVSRAKDENIAALRGLVDQHKENYEKLVAARRSA